MDRCRPWRSSRRFRRTPLCGRAQIRRRVPSGQIGRVGRADLSLGRGVVTVRKVGRCQWPASERCRSRSPLSTHLKHMEIVSAAAAAKVDAPVPRKPAIAYWGARPHASSCGAHPFGRYTLCCAGEGRGMQSTFHRREGARLVGRSHLSLHKPRAIRAPEAKHVLTLYFVRRRTRAGVPPSGCSRRRHLCLLSRGSRGVAAKVSCLLSVVWCVHSIESADATHVAQARNVSGTRAILRF
jgi:hypothetical protein